MTAALFFDPDAYSTTGPKLMGRHAAGASFLRGYLAYSTAREFWVLSSHRDHPAAFTQRVREAGRVEPVQAVHLRQPAALTQPGLVYFPSPNLQDVVWHRSAQGHDAWSLCGITHTLCSAGAMDAIAQLVTAPVQPWDAVICTTRVARDVVQRILQAEGARLRERLGAARLVLPQLPVIPLGVHTTDFVFTDAERAQARGRLGADADTVVVLFAGRLSFHAKAHPLALYQALEQASRHLRSGQRLLLVECGEHPNEPVARAYQDAARLACPSVTVRHLPGREGTHYRDAWAGADIFCSLSDNLQETFGLTPVEAMAAGLPVVVSDWNGYKDTVRDGVDGFRIPTTMPQAGLGGDLALRHALEIDTYDMYCGHTCSLVAVDIEATTQAFVRLFKSPELRRQMGEAGRQRARQTYDWATIIPQYEALWGHLNELRREKAKDLKPLAHPWPARMDPFHAFASYPTQLLTPQTMLALVDPSVDAAIQRVANYRKLSMVDFAKVVLPTKEEVATVLAAAAVGPRAAAELVTEIPNERQAFVFRGLGWLMKLGVLRLT